MRKLSQKLREKIVEANQLRAVMDAISVSAVISKGTQEVLEERFYQVFEKGYTPQEDADGYKPGHLASVAAFLLTGDRSDIKFQYNSMFLDKLESKSLKEQLIIAAAFIIAELDANDVLEMEKGI